MCTVPVHKLLEYDGLCTVLINKLKEYDGLCTVLINKLLEYDGLCTVLINKLKEYDGLWKLSGRNAKGVRVNRFTKMTGLQTKCCKIGIENDKLCYHIKSKLSSVICNENVI